MTRFKNTILLFLLLLMHTNVAIAIEAPIKIEVKTFDGNTIFIFYHGREQQLKVAANGNNVSVTMSIPTGFELLNPGDFSGFATTPQLSKDQKLITFSTKAEFKSQSIINGEKLTAIKFRAEPEEQELQTSAPAVDQKTIDDSSNSKTPEPKSEIKQENKDNIGYKLIKGEHILTFDFGEQNPGMAAFFRGKYLWIVFDQPKIFTFINNSVLTNFTQIASDTNTILKMKVNGYKNARVTKTGKLWNIIISQVENKDKKLVLTPQVAENQDELTITGDFENSRFIEINDKVVGDIIKLITFKTPSIRVEQLKEFIDFNLIPSIQGCVTAISSDESVEFSKDKNSLHIISKSDFLNTNQNNSNDNTSKILLSTDQGSLLPVGHWVDDKKFIDTRSQLISEAGLADNKTVLFSKRLELAKFFFEHGLYKESLSALVLAQKTTNDEYKVDLKSQFLTAVDYTLVGVLDEAAKIYTSLLAIVDQSNADEINLWNNYNAFLFGKNPNKIGFLSNLDKFVNLYPDDLYWPLAFSEIDLCLLSNDLKTVESMFKILRSAPLGKYTNSLQFYKASYYRKKKQLNLTQQFLTDLAQKEDDPFNQVRAEMELVKLQVSKKEISLAEATKRLEALRFLWRGDTLEYDLLLLLAGYYRDQNDSMNALRTYMYISNAFNNQLSNFYITSEMVKIFNGIFLPGGTVEKMSPFEAVSLFNEFKELNPIGVQGDEIILLIARKLMELDLLDQAVELLKHQVSYRLTGEKRIINADHLAIALLMDKKPLEAIKVLDETDKDNFKFDEHKYRLRLKAKALIDTNQYLEALDVLAEDDSKDAQILKKESLFQAEKWKEYIDLVAPIVNNIAKDKINDGAMIQDILRLAIAYYMINDQPALAALVQSLNLNSENEMLKNTVDLLLTTGKPIDYKNLDQSLDINQVQILLEKYKNQLFS
ncbi:Tetratricopeptide repeat-containing protein [Candidatus Trichorickettsia mobilis]|uniref:Tetratricopeptide repeat-containing protein n=1 Tax=Candidatus Trichorickettsia mobilis TaxID=1346319 RepID=A0ABZ0USU2_9RICK|nr:hypothetical protein [Candidatus Trichorickettsia mobilis]WPY00162.1 Tetratricopeptide repeat-containing protein [Candidatus Trichorickettsia mobilis]